MLDPVVRLMCFFVVCFGVFLFCFQKKNYDMIVCVNNTKQTEKEQLKRSLCKLLGKGKILDPKLCIFIPFQINYNADDEHSMNVEEHRD